MGKRPGASNAHRAGMIPASFPQPTEVLKLGG